MLPKDWLTVNDEFVAGFNSGELDRMMRLYVETYIDVNLRNPVQTYNERKEYYRKIIAREDSRIEVIPDEIIISGEHAIVRGTIMIWRKGDHPVLRRRGNSGTWSYGKKLTSGWKSIWGIEAKIYKE